MSEESLQDKIKRRKARKKSIVRILIIVIIAVVSLIIITAAYKQSLFDTTSNYSGTMGT